MRRGDVLIGVHHTPLPLHATLAHVQSLMESLPRPLSLNLFRPSPYGESFVDSSDLPTLHPLPHPAKPLGRSRPHPTPSAAVVMSRSLGLGFLTGSTDLDGTPEGSMEGSFEALTDDGAEGDYGAFFAAIIADHKGYLLTELHHKDDPEATRLELLVM